MTTRIAQSARARLGRLAHQTRIVDWAAWDAVVAAAREAGYSEPLAGYVRTTPRLSLTAMARAYLVRYGQAYGLGVTPATPETVTGALSSYAAA